jgi:hypothetical protein
MSKGYLELTPFVASLFSVLYTLSYVGVLYLSPLTRPRAGLPRDTPFVIRSRIRAVTVVTTVALLLSCFLIILTTPKRTWSEVASLLGFSVRPSSILDISRCFLLTAVLFTGPLLQRLWFEDGWRDLKGDVDRMFTTWIGWRNHIAVRKSLFHYFKGSSLRRGNIYSQTSSVSNTTALIYCGNKKSDTQKNPIVTADFYCLRPSPGPLYRRSRLSCLSCSIASDSREIAWNDHIHFSAVFWFRSAFLNDFCFPPQSCSHHLTFSSSAYPPRL